MEIVILSFTDAGCQMACKVRENFIQSGYRVKVYTLTRFCRLYGFHAFPEDKKSWIGSLWGEKALFFIGAAGIAVRMIAPHVKDKFTDSPVLVMDEKGSYVIPLLSGHVGGAVELAKEIAEKINAQAVLTTATDVEQKFAVDVFAKSNGLVLTDRKKAKEISAVVLDGNKIGLYSVFPVEGKFPEELKLCETEEFLRNYPYGIRIAGSAKSICHAAGGQTAECFWNVCDLCYGRFSPDSGGSTSIGNRMSQRDFRRRNPKRGQ